MSTSIITGSSTLEALGELFNWAEDIQLAYAWATAARGTADHWKVLDLSKVRRAIIGTQFAQTEPWALSQMQEKVDDLRVVITSEGTFHPKLAWGERGTMFRALIGSSNLTVGGFSSNTELNVLIEGRISDPQAASLRDFLDQAWKQGTQLDPAWLARYEEAYRNRPRSAGLVPAAPVEGETLASLDMTWQTFVQVVRGSAGADLKRGNHLRLFDTVGSYFWELDQAQSAFRGTHRFVDMPAQKQHFVFGRGTTTGYFGHMGASLATGSAIKNRASEIGDVLDEVPLEGDIDLATAKGYVERLTDIHGFGLAVATRVLCVKRPDVFVSVNNANREAFQRLGHPVRKRISRYMDLLVAVWGTDWYQAKKPTDPIEQRLWNARAAILDAAVYRG